MASTKLNVETSPSDARQYQFLVLPNQLRALVISDPEADKAGGALTADVGYFSDPEEFPGLAHFLEHMLFMGTEKYPEEAEYSKFINEHGGSNNAYTDTNLTNYQFEVEAESLEGALDRFAQFFISPLFTEEATEREMKAVDSENSKNLQNDMWRKLQLLKSFAHENNPWRKFGTGNLETLGKDPLETRKALLKFHEQFYSANRLCLCVAGREPLEELIGMVERMFSAVPNKEIESPSFGTDHTTCFGGNLELKITRWLPVQQKRMLEFVWAVPSFQKYLVNGSNPSKYVTHLLGHEGKGSILESLKARGWATALTAGPMQDVKEFSLLFVGVTLTPAGLEQYDKVVEVVMHYVAMLNQKGCQQWVFDECKAVQDMSWQFVSKQGPFNYCTHLASNMQVYAPEETISVDYKMKDYDTAAIQQVLTVLSDVKSLRLFLSAPEFSELPDMVTEQWYGTQYCSEPFSEEQVGRWDPSKVDEAAFDLSLPDPNKFITTDFSMAESEGEAKVILLNQDVGYKLWYKLDGKDGTFGLPKVSITCQLSLPAAYSSARHAVYSKLLSMIVTDALAELAYDAEIAELNYSVYHVAAGLRLSFHGYNHKMPELVRIVFAQLAQSASNCSLQRFGDQSQKYKQELTNFFLGQPYSVTDYELGLCLETGKFHIHEYLEVLENVSHEEFCKYSQVLLGQGFLEMLVHGNMCKTVATSIPTSVLKMLAEEVQFVPCGQLPGSRLVKIPAGTEYRYHSQVVNPEEGNSSIELYMQMGRQTLRDGALLDLMAEMIRDDCFETLRTQQQLGYIVFSGTHWSRHVSGFRVIVQSDNTAPEAVYDRIFEFLDKHRAEGLESMTDEAFEEIRNSLAAKKRQKEDNLSQESQKHWNEIDAGAFLFGRKFEVAKELETITKAQVLEFYDAHFSPGVRRTLVVMTHSQAHPIGADPEGVQTVESIAAFRNTAETYPSAPFINKLAEHEAAMAAAV